MFRFAVLVAALVCASCESATDTLPPSSIKQTWLCGREYANHAWGYQRRGSVIDATGNVWRYEVKSQPNSQSSPWQPNDVSRLTEADLKMRYDGSMVSGKKVPPAEISVMIALIEPASQATPSQPAPHGADMGQTLTYCYTYDEVSRTYGQVMIDNRGDWDSTNPSPEARKLAEWIARHLGTDI